MFHVVTNSLGLALRPAACRAHVQETAGGPADGTAPSRGEPGVGRRAGGGGARRPPARHARAAPQDSAVALLALGRAAHEVRGRRAAAPAQLHVRRGLHAADAHFQLLVDIVDGVLVDVLVEDGHETLHQ